MRGNRIATVSGHRVAPSTRRKVVNMRNLTSKEVVTYLAVALLAVIFMVMRDGSQNATPPTPPPIKYAVVEQWAIGPGMGRAITIDPSYRTEASLLALAKQIKAETNDVKGQVHIFIYDDPRAAALRGQAVVGDDLNDRAQQLHDDHMIGSYSRNPATGYHSLMIALDGVAKGTTSKSVSMQ